MMAEIGEEGDDSAVYQCLFSFPSQAARRLFLHLVRNNELTNHEVEGEEQFVVPDQSVIDDAQPLGQVLPPDIAETAARHATMVLFTLEGEDESSQVN
jgi:hypothetical protein